MNMLKFRNIGIARAFCAFFSLFLFATAIAQEATQSSDSDDELVIEEIIVTAQKRERRRKTCPYP